MSERMSNNDSADESPKISKLGSLAMGLGALAAVEAVPGNEAEAAPRTTERAQVPPAQNQEKVLSNEDLVNGVFELNAYFQNPETKLGAYEIDYGQVNSTKVIFEGKVYPFVKDATLSSMVSKFTKYQKLLSELEKTTMSDNEKQLEKKKIQVQQYRAVKDVLNQICQ